MFLFFVQVADARYDVKELVCLKYDEEYTQNSVEFFPPSNALPTVSQCFSELIRIMVSWSTTKWHPSDLNNLYAE